MKIKEFSKAEVGVFGEKVCARYMKRNKLKILDRNSKIGHLETILKYLIEILKLDTWKQISSDTTKPILYLPRLKQDV